MRGWALAVMLLSTSALAFTPGLPGTTESKAVFAGAIGVLFVTALWTFMRCRDEKRYTPLVFRVFAWVAAIVSFELVYFLGAFSPTPVVITLGVNFIGLGRDRRTAVVVPIVAVTGYAIIAGLITAGVLEDRGVIRAPDLTMMPKLFGAVMVPVVLLMTLGLARLSRRTLEEAANRSHEALRLANQREAQLAEANQEVEAALRAGQGQQGRWTGAHAGAWELAEVIGRGAMGEIYAARQRETGDRAAVKLLREDVARDEKLVERFVREGEIASALDVPQRGAYVRDRSHRRARAVHGDGAPHRRGSRAPVAPQPHPREGRAGRAGAPRRARPRRGARRRHRAPRSQAAEPLPLRRRARRHVEDPRFRRVDADRLDGNAHAGRRRRKRRATCHPNRRARCPSTIAATCSRSARCSIARSRGGRRSRAPTRRRSCSTWSIACRSVPASSSTEPAPTSTRCSRSRSRSALKSVSRRRASWLRRSKRRSVARWIAIFDGEAMP